MGFRSGANDSSGQKRHRGAMNVSGSIRGHEIFLLHGAADLDQSAARWLPMGYGLNESSAANYTTRFVCPADGRWIRSVVRCKAAAGVTNLKLYKAVDGTSAAATEMEHTITNVAAVDTSYGFDASGSHHFFEGDVISFKINPASNPDETNFTHVLELFTRAINPSGSAI